MGQGNPTLNNFVRNEAEQSDAIDTVNNASLMNW